MQGCKIRCGAPAAIRNLDSSQASEEGWLFFKFIICTYCFPLFTIWYQKQEVQVFIRFILQDDALHWFTFVLQYVTGFCSDSSGFQLFYSPLAASRWALACGCGIWRRLTCSSHASPSSSPLPLGWAKGKHKRTMADKTGCLKWGASVQTRAGFCWNNNGTNVEFNGMIK